MCIAKYALDDAQKTENRRNLRIKHRNKVTFSSSDESVESRHSQTKLLSQADLAFRHSNVKANIREKSMYKKVELYNYIQKKQSEASDQIFEFLGQVKKGTEAKDIKLQYYYFIGSKLLSEEIQTDCIEEYKKSQDTSAVAKNEHKIMYKDESK